MNGLVCSYALFLIGGAVAVVTWRDAHLPTDDDAARYCRICRSHTMCLFPYDEVGPQCEEVESGELEPEEIEWILHRHNSFRDNMARLGRESQSGGGGGDGGDRLGQPAQDTMQVFWDEELANIARRWALQCKIHEKDECRDVERFAVLQNVNALDLEEVGNLTAIERLKFHMKTWYDESNLLKDAVLFGEASRTAGGSAAEVAAGLARPTVTNVGCGRTTYSVDLRDEEEPRSRMLDGTPRFGRVETLVCNYGPIGDDLEHAYCETYSPSYTHLCLLKLQEGVSQAKAQEEELAFRMLLLGEDDESRRRTGLNVGKAAASASASAATTVSATPGYLSLVVLLLICY